MAELSNSQRKQEAQRLHAEGWPKAAIARHYGVTEGAVRAWLNPERKAAIRRKERERRERERPAKHQVEMNRRERSDLYARLAEVPNDDPRSLTARLLGDPIPGDPRRPWRTA